MLKKDELRRPGSCLNRAAADEPVFVLRAKDPVAAQAIRLWVSMSTDAQPPEKLAEAVSVACDFENWHSQNVPVATEDGRALGGNAQKRY